MSLAPDSFLALMADIARRLRPTVAHMAESDFDAMVRRMAELEVKYRARSAQTGWRQVTPPRGTPAQQDPR